MNINNLMPISQKVYDLLLKNNIKEYEVSSVLKNVYNDIVNNSIIHIKIEEMYFNMLKDIVWYNLERKENADDLKDFGSKYQSFMFCCDSTNIINASDVESIKNELVDIKKKLGDNKILLVQLTGKEELFVIDSKVHFIDKRQTLEKTHTKRKSKEMLSCVIQDSLNAFEMEKIKINSVIDSLIKACEQSLKNSSMIGVDFIA